MQAQHFFDHGFGLGALHCELAVEVALVVKPYVEALHLLLHPLNVLVDVGGVNDKEEIVVAHLIDEEVINGAAVGIEHHAVEYLAVGGTGHVVGEDVLHVALCVGACDAHLAHVRDVEDSAVLAHGIVFIGDVGVLDGHDESAEW